MNMNRKKPNGGNFMHVIKWNESWEFRILHGCWENMRFFQNCMHRLAGRELPPGDSC